MKNQKKADVAKLKQDQVKILGQSIKLCKGKVSKNACPK